MQLPKKSLPPRVLEVITSLAYSEWDEHVLKTFRSNHYAGVTVFYISSTLRGWALDIRLDGLLTYYKLCKVPDAGYEVMLSEEDLAYILSGDQDKLLEIWHGEPAVVK